MVRKMSRMAFAQLHMVISLNVLNFLLSKQFTSIRSFFMFLFSFLLCSAFSFVSCGFVSPFSVLTPSLPPRSQHHASVEFVPLIVDLCGCGCFYTSFIAHILSVEECNLYHLICNMFSLPFCDLRLSVCVCVCA